MPQGGAALPAEIQLVLDRLAERPDALELFHEGPLESAAIMLGVPPVLIARARGYLDSPERRTALTWGLLEARKLVREREQRARREGESGERSAPEPITDPARLLEQLERYPAGRDFVLRGPPEALAVLFGVHPDVVLAARERLGHDGDSRQRPGTEGRSSAGSKQEG